MKKEYFIEQTHLYLMDELDGQSRIELENAMMENDELKDQFELVKKLFDSIIENRPEKADEKLLATARYAMLRAVRLEAQRQSAIEKVIDWLKTVFITNYKYSLGALSLLIVGIFVGYFLFSGIDEPMISTSRSVDLDNLDHYETNISNIRIPNPFTEGGDIEVTFGGKSPITYKGSVDDPIIQKALATTLVKQQNAGLRLRTVNTIASRAELENFVPDPKIKNALITAMKVDKNPAVRREALNVLTKFPFDEEIKDALLFVLSNDKNSGLRVSAINALAQIKEEGISLDGKIIDVLSKKAESDRNDFIRLRAAALVKEVN